MPILDPSLINAFFNNPKTKENGEFAFIKRYLLIASQNIFRNSNTINYSIQFKNNIKQDIELTNLVFKCKLSIEKDFKNPIINNIYKHLFDIMNANENYKLNVRLKGNYYFDEKSNLYFFRPLNYFPEDYTWYLTTTQLAILIVNFYNISDLGNLDIVFFVAGIEADLLLASGFTVVVCVKYNIRLSVDFVDIINLIRKHHFSEIHFAIEFPNQIINDKVINNIEKLLSAVHESIYDIDGYFYFYSPFLDEFSPKIFSILKLLKKRPRFFNICLSQKFNISINYCYLKETKPFIYCYKGFMTDLILIRLSNVPLYDTDDDENDLIPCQSSGVNTCYISANDFSDWTKTRIQIYFIDNNKMNDCFIKYVQFDDIHVIKPDLYVKDNLYLAKMNDETLNLINKILEKSSNKNTKKIVKKSASLSFDFQNNNTLFYVLNAYTEFIFRQNNTHFKIHNNQIFTIIEACNFYLNKKSHGIVYQVETGEGKSCIISLMAAIFALMKKTVHIASSNIALSNRDYNDSYLFFKSLGLKSAVLLHYNELPIKKSDDDENRLKYNPKFYPDEFYNKKLFKNSSNMNHCVCGVDNDNKIIKDKADIVFSTFVNFESVFLKFLESCSSYDYFCESTLIIDEADSILIDELTNGTILSRSVKTNGNEVLCYVYQSYIDKKEPEILLSEIHKQWPECIDLNLENIKDMYNEINLINQEEFTDGKKYSIETIKIKEKNSLAKFLNNSQEFVKNTKKKIKDGVKRLFVKKAKSEELKNKKKHKNKTKIYKQIIPFDFDHKGVLEPNKEFSGFVQQFIAIKEMFNNKNNQNMIIKEVSMNYLFVSHPIFVGLYKNVFGLTGTIGNKYDKEIFHYNYGLLTKKIPRENPNFRIEYPTLLCDDFNDRNHKITSEIISFNRKGNPVLVIFQDLNEISSVLKLLNINGITNVNIFDGKDDKIKPDLVAGLEGAVSLGTNVCGRGTNIKKIGKPLHVIITYYTSNSRVMQQAFGRTARQGQEGSVRIICIKKQFFSPISIYMESDMEKTLSDFNTKNIFQNKFIEYFRVNRSWIFSGEIKTQHFTDEEIELLRGTRINVNRIKACNYKFPICMSIQTFLIIQSQKIFSLYNCPNCKYTWMLFQKYVREMILESWSIFIENADRNYYKLKNENKISQNLNEYLQNTIESLYSCVKIYLPINNNKEYGIVPTFMHIFEIVKIRYEKRIIELFPKELTNCLKQVGKKQFCSFTIGFKPYSLVDKSGARINILDGEEQKQTYIEDPELKYMRKKSMHSYLLLSITEKIDGLFNMICEKINEIIGSYIGLKFFLRRTLGGCEFGVCYDMTIKNINENLLNDPFCIVDKDPLLLFTISVKSMVPLLAGILIIGLVYIASVAKSISEWILNFAGKGIKEIAKITVKNILSQITETQISQFCNVIITFLTKQILKQIDKMSMYRPELAKIFTLLLKISVPKDFNMTNDVINKILNNGVNLSFKVDFIGSMDINVIQHFLKIGLLLMLCFASFMMNFHFHNESLKYNSKKVALEYDEKQKTEEAFEQNKKYVETEKINDSIN